MSEIRKIILLIWFGVVFLAAMILQPETSFHVASFIVVEFLSLFIALVIIRQLEGKKVAE